MESISSEKLQIIWHTLSKIELAITRLQERTAAIKTVDELTEGTLLPFRPKDLKKNIGNKHNTYITIPIRYSDNTVEDFELCFSVWYELPPQTE